MAVTGEYGAKRISGYDQIAIPRMSPQAAAFHDEQLQGVRPGVNAGISRLSQFASGDEAAYAGLEQGAYRDFDKLLGKIGSRYAGVGSGEMSGRRGSAFSNEVSGAAGDLAAKLQAQRLDIQQNALKELFGLSESLLSNSPYEYNLMPKKKKRNWWQSTIGIGAPIVGAAAGGYFGGPAGAAAGAKLGSEFGSAFLD